MRRLVGWESIRYELAQYIEKQVQARCFEVGEEEDCFSSYPPCTYGRSCVQRTWMMRGCSLRAVRYPSLHPAMERHVRLAMREYEWYNNLSDEFYVEKEVIDRKRFRSFQHGDPGLFRLVECHKYGERVAGAFTENTFCYV